MKDGTAPTPAATGLPGLPRGFSGRWWAVFRVTLPHWLLAYLGVLFPLCTLLVLDAYLKFLTWGGAAKVSSGLVLIFSFFALVAALAAAAPALLPGRAGGWSSRAAPRVSAFLALAFSLQVLAQTAWEWARRVTGHPGRDVAGGDPDAPFFLALALAVSLALFLLKGGLAAGVHAVSRRFAPFAAVIVAGAIAVAGAVLVSDRLGREAPTAPGNASGAAGGRPNIILVTFDSLSAGEMSLYGYPLPTTPSIDAFAGSAFVFESMYANGNWTAPTMASLITGKYPLTHRTGFWTPSRTLDRRDENLAHLLKKAGYRTAIVTGNPRFSSPRRQGSFADFDVIVDWTHRMNLHSGVLAHAHLLDPNIIQAYLHSRPYFSPYREVFSAAVSAAENLLARGKARDGEGGPDADFNSGTPQFRETARLLRESRQPLFVICHIFPPHPPFLPSPARLGFFRRGEAGGPGGEEGQGSRELRLLYDEQVLSVDDEFGAFLQTLGEQGSLEGSLIVVSADHGEGVSPYYLGHQGRNLPQSIIHIPLLVRLPGQREGRRVGSPAEQVDLAPTLLDLLGLPVPGWMEGESLKGCMEEGRISGKPKFAMSLDLDGIRGPLREGMVAVMVDGYKLIHDFRSHTCALFNLRLDPEERDNLVLKDPLRVEKMNRLILEKVPR